MVQCSARACAPAGRLRLQLLGDDDDDDDDEPQTPAWLRSRRADY